MKAANVQPLPSVLSEKLLKLREILIAFQEIGVAFSGGVDSTLLAWVARDTLGRSRAWAFHLQTPLHTKREFAAARQIAGEADIYLSILRDNPLDSPEFTANTPERCYICKKRLYNLILDKMRQRMPRAVLIDGTNLDDLGEHRPGLAALHELGVRTPLAEAKISKAEVRELARLFGLTNWNLPSASCLATRIPSGNVIVTSELQRVARLEEYLLDFGLKGHRIRLDGEKAVLELEDADFSFFTEKYKRDTVLSFFRQHEVRQVFLNLVSRKGCGGY